jgi:hypothetical protein
MRPDDVRDKLKLQPFQPFRIRLSNGAIYNVVHPDMILVGRSTIVIGTPAPDLPSGVYDTVTVSLLHVAEFLPMTSSPTPPGTNGPAA